MERSTKIFRWSAGLWAVFIFTVSTMPGKQLPRVDWLNSPDKFGHAAVYAIFAWLLYKSRPNAKGFNALLWPALLASAFGVAMEIVQFAFFPGRYFELWDIVANITGAFTAMVICKQYY